MKKNNIIYWTLTGLVSAAFLMSSTMYLGKNPELVNGFNQMGFPLFMVTLLGTAKLLGALAIINPWSPRLREWAYAGFTFVLIGAAWTHAATNTPMIAPLGFLVLLAASYYFHLKRVKTSEETRGVSVSAV